MEVTRSEENRNRAISAALTSLIFGLLLLFLILFKLVRPNPPFPEGGGGGGQELALGIIDVGNDRIDFTSMGAVTDVVVEKTAVKEEEKVVTAEGGEDVQLHEVKPKVKENVTVITPVKPKPEPVKEKTEAEKLAEKFKKKGTQSGGGIGQSDEAGASGSPEGDPFKSGTGGTGTGTGGGDGVGEGPGSGPGSRGIGGGFSYGLSGRSVLQKPKLPSDTKEEGKVVVEITVDSEGNVTEANPNGRGTNTSSAMLKAKAKQAAMATKFNVDSRYEEQHGTITIIFSFN
jgi:TonB family protein